ncbi:MAG: hypothetical protein MHPSP_004194, partial [Paramarteilia canceri]
EGVNKFTENLLILQTKVGFMQNNSNGFRNVNEQLYNTIEKSFELADILQQAQWSEGNSQLITRVSHYLYTGVSLHYKAICWMLLI